MKRTMRLFIMAAMLWAPFAHGEAVSDTPTAVPALHSLPVAQASYSFSELVRMSFEAEASLAGSTSVPAPFAVQEAHVKPASEIRDASVGSSAPAHRLVAAREMPSTHLPRPDGWLMLVSWLAVIAFIAWRRSERVA